jgi:hypothetical protein
MPAPLPRSSDDSVDDLDDPAVLAAYVAALTGDLAKLCQRQGFDTLGYLLDMARLEAQTLARYGGEPGPLG